MCFPFPYLYGGLFLGVCLLALESGNGDFWPMAYGGVFGFLEFNDFTFLVSEKGTTWGQPRTPSNKTPRSRRMKPGEVAFFFSSYKKNRWRVD